MAAARTVLAATTPHLDGWAACILADDERDALDARAIARDMRADAARIRARATSPAPEPAAAERAVVEAADAWRAALDGPGECWHEARLREAVDALGDVPRQRGLAGPGIAEQAEHLGRAVSAGLGFQPVGNGRERRILMRGEAGHGEG